MEEEKPGKLSQKRVGKRETRWRGRGEGRERQKDTPERQKVLNVRL